MVSMIGREAHRAKISQLRWMRRSSSRWPGLAQLYRCIPGGMDESEYIGGCQASGIEADEAGFGGQVDDGGGYGRVFQQFLFQGVDTGGAVQAADAEGYLLGASLVVMTGCSVLKGVFLYQVVSLSA